MNDFVLWTFSLGQLALVGVSAFWLVKRRDELPLIASLLLFYVFTFRLWALLQGWTAPISLRNFGFEDVEPNNAVAAQGIAILGETVLLGVYFAVQRSRIGALEGIAPAELLSWLRLRVFALAAVCIIFSVAARRAVSARVAEGRSMGFEISNYMSLFPLALVGVAILIGGLWKAGALRTAGQKLIGLGSFALIAFFTFSPALRFQFLGWVLGVTIILSSGFAMGRRIAIGGIGLTLAVALFATAGALRQSMVDSEEFEQQAWERFAYAHDANMLDGLVLLRQVYPDMLEFSYGMEHFEILTRPIPRAVWPDKPVGGYMNKLGIVTADTGFTLGISPSLFGSFYQEGGLLAVVVLSALYGFGFARLIRFSTTILPLGGLLIRGMTCAALVPLLRGGDLPGIYAWFGMSFWPVFLIMWLRRVVFFSPASTPPNYFQRPVTTRSALSV